MFFKEKSNKFFRHKKTRTMEGLDSSLKKLSYSQIRSKSKKQISKTPKSPLKLSNNPFKSIDGNQKLEKSQTPHSRNLSFKLKKKSSYNWNTGSSPKLKQIENLDHKKSRKKISMANFYRSEDQSKLAKTPTPKAGSSKNIFDRNFSIRNIEKPKSRNSSSKKSRKRRNSQTIKSQIQLQPKHTRSQTNPSGLITPQRLQPNDHSLSKFQQKPHFSQNKRKNSTLKYLNGFQKLTPSYNDKKKKRPLEGFKTHLRNESIGFTTLHKAEKMGLSLDDRPKNQFIYSQKKIGNILQKEPSQLQLDSKTNFNVTLAKLKRNNLPQALKQRFYKRIKSIEKNFKKCNVVMLPSRTMICRHNIITGFAVNTHQGITRHYNEDRVAILLNSQKKYFSSPKKGTKIWSVSAQKRLICSVYTTDTAGKAAATS